MSSRASLALAVALALSAAGCPSKEGEQKDAQTSSSGTPVGTGPLANLEASPFMNEVWKDDGGQQLPMIYYTRENLRMSASCRAPDGKLACAAIQYLRSGQLVQIPHRELDGRQSAGVKACRKLGYSMTVLRNSVGAEDSMCRFPDGSLLSNGALETYGMRIIEQ